MMEQMELYGWDQFKEEGLKELERIKSDKFLDGKDELIYIIQRYMDIYKANRIYKKEDISAIILYQIEKAAQREAEKEQKKQEEKRSLANIDKSSKFRVKTKSIDEATKDILQRASKDKDFMDGLKRSARDGANKGVTQLRKFFGDASDGFYNTEEGKQSEYRISFVAKGEYRLKVQVNTIKEKNEQKIERTTAKDAQDSTEEISYEEEKHFAIPYKYKPVLLELISSVLFWFFVIALIVVSFGTIYTGLFSSKKWMLFFIDMFLIIAAVASIAFMRLPSKKFVFFMLNEYFLRLTDDKIIFVSDKAECPVCGGAIVLTAHTIKYKWNKSYIGKCIKNPDQHNFTFDHVSMKGERILQ